MDFYADLAREIDALCCVCFGFCIVNNELGCSPEECINTESCLCQFIGNFFLACAFSCFLILDFQTDLANLVNTAAIRAAVEGAEKLTAAHLEYAKDRIMMGTERKTMHLSEESKKVRCTILIRKFLFVKKLSC